MIKSPPPSRRGIFYLLRQTEKYPFSSVLDLGAGNGYASLYFHENGKTVTTTSYSNEAYPLVKLPDPIKVIRDVDICNLREINDNSFDAIWCSHVIEHVQNPGLALSELRRILKPDGYLFLVVPEYSPVLVGGHVSTGWTVGTLIYNLILSGFDTRTGSFINHCWNIAGFVKKHEKTLPSLNFDNGDLEKLACFFPESMLIYQGINSNFMKINWDWNEPIKVAAEAEFRKACLHRSLKNLIPAFAFEKLKKIKKILFGL